MIKRLTAIPSLSLGFLFLQLNVCKKREQILYHRITGTDKRIYLPLFQFVTENIIQRNIHWKDYMPVKYRGGIVGDGDFNFVGPGAL